MSLLTSSFLIPFIVACVSCYLTMQLALLRFYREKWWDKKQCLYIEVIESLYVLKEDYAIIYDRFLSETQRGELTEASIYSKDDEDNAWRRIDAMNSNFEKWIGIGPLVFSDKAIELISDFMSGNKTLQRSYKVNECDMSDVSTWLSSESARLFDTFKQQAVCELRIKRSCRRSIGEMLDKIKKCYKEAEESYEREKFKVY
ncbi:hypothetical protein NMD64_08015 [Edwardsiella tarda]|uniref:hypothetical protein n=1 Tax=Edwardsiella tarda TaxID=636 RepID=UPI00351BF608